MSTLPRLFFDAASAPRMRPEVRSLLVHLRHAEGNPESLHEEGRRAKMLLEDARAEIGGLLSVKKDEIIFTSGGTESNNLAILGSVGALIEKGHAPDTLHAMVLVTEHPSVLECFKELERLGVAVTYVPVLPDGFPDEARLLHALKENTVLLSIALVQGETGVVMPLRALTHAARQKKRVLGGLPLQIHTDASQAPLYVDPSPHTLGVDLLTLDGRKVKGPQGIGVLYRSLTTPLRALFFGGDQEFGLRPGTPQVVGALGFARALALACDERKHQSAHMEICYQYLFSLLREVLPEVVQNGNEKRRTPHIINVSIPGVDAEFLTAMLDEAGVALSTRSACIGSLGGSEVVRHMTGDDARAKSAIRISFDTDITKSEIARGVRSIHACVLRYRDMYKRHPQPTLEQKQKS